MQINRSNYEIFFLDYWENNLGKQDKEELARFLESNPNLQDEFLEYKETCTLSLIPNEEIYFDGKSKLKHQEIEAVGKINDQNFETHIIAHLEGDHSLAQQKEFDDFMHKNPQLNWDLKLYGSTYLQADKRVVYNNKQQLKRSLIITFRAKVMLYSSVVAAIFLLAFLIFNPLQQNEIPDNSELVNIKENIKMIADDISSNIKNEELSNNLTREVLIAENNNLQTSEPETTDASDLSGEIMEIANELHVQKSIRIHLAAEVVSLQNNSQSQPLLSETIVATKIAERTELSAVFNDLILRDVRQIEKRNKEEKSAFARIMDNIVRQFLGINPNDSHTSLLAEAALKGKERFSDFVENSPRIESSSDQGKKQTYFSINENFSIKISKGESKP